jgi:hypothetical protein
VCEARRGGGAVALGSVWSQETESAFSSNAIGSPQALRKKHVRGNDRQGPKPPFATDLPNRHAARRLPRLSGSPRRPAVLAGSGASPMRWRWRAP